MATVFPKIVLPHLKPAQPLRNLHPLYNNPRPSSSLSTRFRSSTATFNGRGYPFYHGPRSWLDGPNWSSSCFQCGRYGHYARDCRSPAKCFSCGEVGHKRRSCHASKTEGSKSSIFRAPAREMDDESELLIQVQTPMPDLPTDAMLLDPDVAFCFAMPSSGTDFPDLPEICNGDGPSAACEPVADITMESPPLVEDSLYPDEDPYPCYHYAAFNSAKNRPVDLDLAPVRLEDFFDFEIIDDFEDYYSDDESPRKPNPLVIEDLSANLPEDNGRGEAAISFQMDHNKFMFYCFFQAVDAFNRVARAIARGSTKLSPFVPKSIPKKSKRPVKMDSPASVCRSPRLNKDLCK